MTRWIIAAMIAAGAMLFPAAASASTCGDNGTTKFFDSQGYYFDFYQPAALAQNHNEPFATFDDSGSNGILGTPQGPVDNNDSYDEFGALFVGGANDDAHIYFANNDSCSDPAPGERDFPVVGLSGLQVQRKVFVNPVGPLPGARILDLISNPGGAPVTTTVQVGDLASTNNDGDLGSDNSTAVRASSNGDLAASPADYWAVTNDDPTTTDDNTLAHVIDGQGGAVKANLFQVGGGTVVSDQPEDNVAWGWTVTIPANSTVGLLSVEVQQGTFDLDSATDTVKAADAANSYESAPLSELYAGVSNADAVNVVNWPHPPAPTPVKHKKKCKKKKHHKRSAASAKKHKKCKKKKHKR